MSSSEEGLPRVLRLPAHRISGPGVLAAGALVISTRGLLPGACGSMATWPVIV